MPSLVLYPIADAHVNGKDGNVNYGSETNMKLDENQDIYLKFDLSSIPSNSIITSATLRIGIYAYVGSYANTTYELRRVTATWNENTITWNNAPTDETSGHVSGYLFNGTQTNITSPNIPITVKNDLNDVIFETRSEISWRLHGTTVASEEFLIYSRESGQNTTFLEVEYSQGIREVFLSSGTWVCPSNVSSVDVRCFGSGGGGGAGHSSRGGSGAGGGAFSKKLGVGVTAGTSYTVTVGSAGTGDKGSDDATDGGDSWFSTTGTVLAKGGLRGRFASNTVGVGGLASGGVGDIKYSGGNGGPGIIAGDASGGGGGAGDNHDGKNAPDYSFGAGGRYEGGDGGDGQVPTNAKTYGGGGYGGANGVNGGNGAKGVVIISYLAPVNLNNYATYY